MKPAKQPVLREADAWGVARANTQRQQAEAQAQANSEAARQARRDHNRKLADALVLKWSAIEYRERFDDELAIALDGKHDGAFDPKQEKYHKPVAKERGLGGSEAAAATYRAREERKRKEAQFVSVQFSGRKK